MAKKKSSSKSPSKTFSSLKKDYKESLEKERIKFLTPYAKKQEKKTLQQRQEELKKEYSKKKKDYAKKKIERAGKSVQSFVKGALTLKKPKAKLPSASGTKFISQMGAETSGKLVKPVEDKYSNPPQDNRSLFFKDEYKFEKRKSFGGFI